MKSSQVLVKSHFVLYVDKHVMWRDETVVTCANLASGLTVISPFCCYHFQCCLFRLWFLCQWRWLAMAMSTRVSLTLRSPPQGKYLVITCTYVVWVFGEVLLFYTTYRVIRPPGGGGSLNIFGGSSDPPPATNKAQSMKQATPPQPKQAPPPQQASTVAPQSKQVSPSQAPTTVPTATGSTRRTSTKVHAPPGGKSSFSFYWRHIMGIPQAVIIILLEHQSWNSFILPLQQWLYMYIFSACVYNYNYACEKTLLTNYTMSCHVIV